MQILMRSHLIGWLQCLLLAAAALNRSQFSFQLRFIHVPYDLIYMAILRTIVVQSNLASRRSLPCHFWKAARSAVSLMSFHFVTLTLYLVVTRCLISTERTDQVLEADECTVDGNSTFHLIFLLALFYFELIAIAHGGRGLPCFKSGQETVMEETDEEDDHNVEGVSQADRCVIDQLLDDIYQWRKMEGKEKWDVIKLIQYKHGEPLKSLNPRISNILKVCYDYGYTHDPVHDSTRAPKERNSNRLTACETWFKPEWISIHVSPEILTDIVGHFLDDIYKWKKVEKNSKSAMINLIVTSYGEFLKDLNSRVPWTGIIIQPCWHYGYTALEGQKGVPVEVNSNRLYACKVLFKPELLSENRELMTRLQE